MTKFFFTFSVCCILFLTLLHQVNAGPNDPVSIPDTALRAVIETKLGKNSGDPITESDMNGMTGQLSADRASISDLTGLEHATGLTDLSLRFNEITNIKPLKDLTSLTILNLQGNTSLSNISYLKELHNLARLFLVSTSVTNSDLSAVLPSLSSLSRLNLHYTPVSDLSVLEKLSASTQLSSLGVQGLWDRRSLPATQLGWLLKDISPLVDLMNAGKFTASPTISTHFNWNLDYESYYTHIPALLAVGANVLYGTYDPDDRPAGPEPGIERVSAENAVGRPGTRYRFVVQAYNGMHNYLARVQGAQFGPEYHRNTNFKGVPVTWTVTGPDGSVSVPKVVKTGADGLSRFSITLGSHEEVHTATAVVPAKSNTQALLSHAELRVDFTATADRNAPIPTGLTVNFDDYPEKPPTEEFPLTIRFSELVTDFQMEDITVETELDRGTGTATLKALTPVEGPEQTYTATIEVPTRATGTVKLIVHPAAAFGSISGIIGPATDTASEPIEFGRRGPLVFPSYVPMDKVIFNEFRNAENDQNDWVELKNISDKEVSLKDYEISMVASEGEHRDIDRDIVAFPDWTLPAGGILLILNTDPSENDLLRGQNLENPNHNPDLRPWSLIRPEMILPDTPYLLILRNARDKNGKWEGFEDIVGDYHRGDVNYRTQIWPLRDTWVYTGTEARFSEGEVYQRIMRPKGAIPMKPMERGYFHDAWAVSEYQSGLGYDPNASPETSLGTPGYAMRMEDDVGTGQISFSEIMFETNERGVPSQWIEFYNNSSEKVDLEGWTLVLEVRDGPTAYHHTMLTLKPLDILPNQTVLLVGRRARNSGNIPESRIYDIYRQNGESFRRGASANKILGSEGFALRLLSPDGTLVDMVGNLNGRPGLDKPRWTLPAGWTEVGARSSLIRRYEDRGFPFQGTVPGSWVRASETALIGAYTYWGLATDNGTPGYRQGSPLPVTLASLRADLRDGGVVVKWTTASEMENAGFNILRGKTKKGQFVKVNPTLILGAGTTAEQNTYTWTDTTANPTVAYYYQLEEISLSGERRAVATVRLRGHISAANKMLWKWADVKSQD